jgi:ParB family chromosome partitioning protein
MRHLDDIDAWDMATTIPCRLVPANTGANLAIALLENLARENVPPLEEADAFAQLQKLDPVAWSTANIADRIGKTPRYVYQRLSLVNKLAPESSARSRMMTP